MLSRKTKKHIYMAAGFFSLGLGFIGALLPVMPTTPFLIIAAFFFSRGSKKWHHWLMHHPVMGRTLRDWDYHGVVRMRAKATASILITISLATTFIFVPLQIAVKAVIAVTLGCALLFIWTRPSVPRSTQSPQSDQSLDELTKTK
jgi:uncharacterized membrane protein YbaN (DUF454 family)